MSPEEKAVWLRRINEGFCEKVPHNRSLGLEILDFDDSGCVCRIPFRDDLSAIATQAGFHFGVVTSLLDAASGGAAFIKLKGGSRVATLDLRVDFPVTEVKGDMLWASATCYRVTEHVAFTRAVAYLEEESEPVGVAMGTFRIFRRSTNGH